METLNGTPPPVIPPQKPWGMETNNYLMLMHLSQFAGILVPLAGLIMPLVMWLSNNERFPEVDRHGKVILNWLISVLIYGAVAGLLSLVFIGIPLLVILGILAIVFPVIGAVRASRGELWPYPLSIPFFK